MISKEAHRKHVALAKPETGEFAPFEISLVGAPCSIIQELASNVAAALSKKYRLGYVDASHAEAEGPSPTTHFTHVYTDQISHRSLEVQANPNDWHRGKLFRDTDLTIINGNHFHAKRQIVLIHEGKRASLQRKIDRLTDVVAVIQISENASSFDFIEEVIHEGTPHFTIDNIDAIAQWIADEIDNHKPPVNGLVLAGGKSQRMGFDKTSIDYFGKPHKEHLGDLLSNYCDEVYVSVRPDQEYNTTEYNPLPDSFTGLGPFGGILSAFRQKPSAAWLVVASDLPLVSDATINFLLRHRNPSKFATAFHNGQTGFPDPLITLWEPKAYAVMLDFLAQGNSCPRKVLINSDIEMITGEEEWLTNVNTPEDLKAVEAKLAASFSDQS